MKRLIIVESPSKAKTIKSFLSSGDQVIASKGHIRDLPKRTMGIEIKDGNFTPVYEVSKDHAKQVEEIKALAKQAKEIYIATDEDREGEAIGYHIAVLLGSKVESVPRIVFHEVTKKAILSALENPRSIDMRKVNAQQARRLLDRLVGYNLSPLLASKIQRGLSAGRVQSAALKIVVDREREINAFVSEEYWLITGAFEGKIEAELISFDSKPIEKMSIKNAEQAEAIRQALKESSFVVGSIEKKERKAQPQPPFITSTLQQSASSKLGFAPKRTMSIAQKLYEGVPTDKGESGVITYMRTDSFNIAPEANNAARAAIAERFGGNYVSANTRFFKTKAKGAQEAHEAIRPTDLDFTPQKAAKFLGRDELKLYTLIYNRFLATQMSEAVFETIGVMIESQRGVFKVNGRRLIFDGFYRVWDSDDKDKLLPALTSGAPIKAEDIVAEQKFTEPPNRYSEAGLIKALEQLGIGRPSTYAPTLSLLDDRGYIKVEKKQITAEPIAFTVIEMLEQHFADIVDSSFTAKMEERLDEVAESHKDWQSLLNEFYEPFIAKVQQGKSVIESKKVSIELNEQCPLCGARLLKRVGRFGEFISCSAYPKCRYSRSADDRASAVEAANEVCEKCGSPMVVRNGKRGAFLACSAYPKCKNTKPIGADKGGEEEKIAVKCPKCGGEIKRRMSRRGAFYGCSNYPKCNFISKYAPSEIICSKCGYPMARRVLRGKEICECVNAECKHKEEIA
ncbi:MAG: type I DNA topoisomerase [Helicobacteraceae bacterium]|jgi:DNA topoisomerase-1|nr:type I DNA topoisomerase [Helicobacteraceae bacterium]